MRGKQRLRRVYRRYRAGKYGGRSVMTATQKKKVAAWGTLMICIGSLYIKKLPADLFAEKSAKFMQRMLEVHDTAEKTEEVLSVQYVEGIPELLLVSRMEGEIPEYVPVVTVPAGIGVREVLEDRFGNLSEVSFLDFFSNYYIEDSSTEAVPDLFDPEVLAAYDCAVEKKDSPQILIFHTHGSEGYADSRPGVTEDTVIGAGEILAKELRETYGYEVIHETTVFDRKGDGSDDRNNAYNNALPVITSILKKYPSVEVVIDLHRDSGEARTSVINGVSTAKVMLFNGLCRTKDGPVTYYSNKNLQGNLAFSLHLQVTGNELYPGLMHRIYLKSYRYNMHLKEKYTLVELGTQKNTVAEAKAAMIPFAETIATVLAGGDKTE